MFWNFVVLIMFNFKVLYLILNQHTVLEIYIWRIPDLR